MFIGDTVRYVESVQSTQNGTTVTTASVDVGVSFQVKPRIGANNNITLDLAPTFTLLKGFTDVPGGGQVPQTSERRATSTMTIRDGETIAIGGLIQDQDILSVGGIPFLKDIPIIGYLFKRTDKSKVRTEVVFFLTAKVVDNSNRALAANPKSNNDLKMPEPPESKDKK
jgi:type II secretory pathway component GspD/PulD (secretin)